MSLSKSRVRVVHNVANGPMTTNIYLDDKQVLANVSYKTISDYMLVNSGEHIFTAEPECPPGIPCETAVLVQGQVMLEPETSYTVIMHGLSEEKGDLLVLEDDLTCPSSGNAHLRLVHAAAGLPPVDLYAAANDGSQKDVPLFEKVNYGETGRPTYLSLPSDIYKITITYGVEALGTYLFLQDQQIYTVIVSGGSMDMDALVTEDNHGMCIVL